MSHLIKSFGRDEADAYCDWIDGAESSGEMNSCENRAEIILRLARQELEQLGHKANIIEDYVEAKSADVIYRICGHVGLSVISLGVFNEDENVLSVEVYDDSLEALAEVLGKIPPALRFPYCLIGKSIKIGDDEGIFHINFIGRVPVVSWGGRHCFFEGELVAGGCDSEGHYAHAPISAIEKYGYIEARREQ